MIFARALLNRKGSGLVLVMVMTATMAVVIPIGYMIIQSSMTRQAERATRERYTQMIMTLKTQLESPLVCPEILRDVVVPNAIDTQSNIALNWKFEDMTRNVGPGWKSPNLRTLEVQSVYIKRTGPNFDSIRYRIGGNTRTYTSVPIRLYIKPAKLGINLDNSNLESERKPETVKGMKRSDLMIRLWANVDSANRIFSCYGADSPGAICESRGGAFNITSTNGVYCQPDKICFASVDGLKDNSTSCPTDPYVYKAKSMGVINGKIRYICSLCFDDLP